LLFTLFVFIKKTIQAKGRAYKLPVKQKMRCNKYLIIQFLLFMCSLHSVAQDSEYVYKDTTVLSADSIATRNLVIDTKKNNAVNEKDLPDTVLQNRQFETFKDSAEALKNNIAFKYAKNLDSILITLQKKQQTQTQPVRTNLSWLEKFFFSSVTKIFFWVLACLFIGFIIYKLFIAEGFFKKQTVSKKVKVLPAEKEHLFALTDYGKLIIQAAANKNYPLAIRYHYLQTLQKLAAKRAIEFTPDKTNNEYSRGMFGKPYKEEFDSLTHSYEYAWYGKFDISEAMFTAIEKGFKQFNTQL